MKLQPCSGEIDANISRVRRRALPHDGEGGALHDHGAIGVVVAAADGQSHWLVVACCGHRDVAQSYPQHRPAGVAVP